MKERSEFEAPGVLRDFDHDGRAEVVHWQMMGNKEWLVISDGQTGKIQKQTLWPTKPLPHVYNNFRLAIAKLSSGPPNELAVFTDMGGVININAYTGCVALRSSSGNPVRHHSQQLLMNQHV